MMHDSHAGQPLSLWAATGGEIPLTPPLQDNARVDVAIVGAGYTGLSTALHLAERGVSVCVLDTHAPGWGASGRNGGQVIPGLKYDPDQLRVMFGSRVADPLIAAIGSAADTVFDLIERHGIDCDARRDGWIQPTHSHKVMRALEARARQWIAEGAPAQLMDGAEVARRIGTAAYVGDGRMRVPAACIRSSIAAGWRARRSAWAWRSTAIPAWRGWSGVSPAGGCIAPTVPASTPIGWCWPPMDIPMRCGRTCGSR